MTERKKIEDRLRKKEQEIGTFEDKIKATKVYIQALRDILKMLDNEDDGSSPESVLRSGSAVDQARQVILERGTPVHINELLEALGKEVTRESKASLTSSLAAYVRRSEIFTRPAPSTFGLAELGHETMEESQEPPDDFGRDPPPDDEAPF
jgi:hypothetical protein